MSDPTAPYTAAEVAFVKKMIADGLTLTRLVNERLVATVEAQATELADAHAAILDIDAHASPFGADEDGFVSGGYVISVGCLHRALGVVGHSAGKRRDHAVQLDYAHGPDCDGCQKVKDAVFEAIRHSRSAGEVAQIRQAHTTGDSS